jgi:hypothetical protein
MPHRKRNYIPQMFLFTTASARIERSDEQHSAIEQPVAVLCHEPRCRYTFSYKLGHRWQKIPQEKSHLHMPRITTLISAKSQFT